jgi:hypothetical protein
MLNTIRKQWAKFSRDASKTCQDCGRDRGFHPSGTPLYFIPQCADCARKGGVPSWNARYDAQLRQYVAACMSACFENGTNMVEAERELNEYVYGLRKESYAHAKAGRHAEARAATEAADKAQAEWDANKAALAKVTAERAA